MRSTDEKLMSSTHYIEWKPSNLRGHGVFCKNCDCFLAQARKCVTRDDESFCFESVNVVNVHQSDSRGQITCRCGSFVDTVIVNHLLHLTGVNDHYIRNSNRCAESFSFVLTPIMHAMPKNGFLSCQGCNRVICANAAEVRQNHSYIKVPAYVAPNIKCCDDEKDEEPNSAMCYCGFFVGHFIGDNHLILDSVDQIASMGANQNGLPYRCNCLAHFQNNNNNNDEIDDESDMDSGMEADDTDMSDDN